MILPILCVVALVLVIWFMPGGCTGDCEQGRKTCNCDNKWEK